MPGKPSSDYKNLTLFLEHSGTTIYQSWTGNEFVVVTKRSRRRIEVDSEQNENRIETERQCN